jgi:hypothetical protein
MKNQENELKMNDAALILFVFVVIWLLVFQSGIFG